MSDTGERLDAILERADDAVDRGSWDEVEVLAAAALEMDRECVEATGLLALSRRRRTRSSIETQRDFDAERRTLTVMFCDLVGSTEIADRHDPEDTRAMLQWYHRLVGEVVERYGGFVARYMGDGALVYFGWPTAIDDSALCAVRTALDLLHGMDAERDALRARLGTDVEIRIGVHTGLVVVGAMGSARRRERDDVVGDTPNIAARLEGFATPGTVVVSGDTYALVSDRVDATSLGLQALKGIARPIEVHRVDGIVDRPTRFGLRRTSVPIIGRSTELQDLLDRFGAITKSGVGELISIRAEPGVGKSRLLDTFIAGLGGEVTIVRAQCNEFLIGTAFHPMLDAVRHRGALIDGTEVHPLLDDRLDAIDVVDDDVRTSLLNSIVDRLLAVDDGRPVVVAVEDVHWADPSTLDVLATLVTAVAHAPALVVVTHRPGQVPEWLEERTTIQLQPLGRAGFDDLVSSLAGDRSFSSHVYDRLFDRTGGVPLFVEELVRSLVEFGDQSDEMEIPASLTDVLVTRLDRCGSAKRTGQIASVFGRGVSIDLLDRVTGVSDLVAHLDVLVRAGVLEHEGGDSVRFRHALVQDAAYSTMLRSTARMIHERAAAAIAELHPEIAREAPEILARHLHRAGRPRDALDLYRAAAEQSIERSAFHETVAHLTGALACLDEVEETAHDLELSILLQLGPALLAARGYGSDEVMQTYERAAKLSGAAPDSVEAFGVLHGLTAFFLVSEDLERSEELASNMAAHAARRGDPDDLLEADAWLGTVHFFRGHLVGAEELLTRAADAYRLDHHGWHADRFGLDPAVLALSHLSWLLLLRGHLEPAERRRDEMLGIADALDQAVARAHSLNYAAGFALMVGDSDEALRLANSERMIAEEARLPHYVAYAQILAAAAMRDTDPAAAVEQLRAGLRLRRETGARLAIAFHHALLAELESAAGRVEIAYQAISEARHLAADVGERWWYPEIERIGGEIELQLGQSDAAVDSFRRSIDSASSMGADRLTARTCLTLAGMHMRAGRLDDARCAVSTVDAVALGRLPERQQLTEILDELR